MSLKIVETEDGDVFLGSLGPAKEPGLVKVSTGFVGRPVYLRLEEIDSITDAEDDPRVMTLGER